MPKGEKFFLRKIDTKAQWQQKEEENEQKKRRKKIPKSDNERRELV